MASGMLHVGACKTEFVTPAQARPKSQTDGITGWLCSAIIWRWASTQGITPSTNHCAWGEPLHWAHSASYFYDIVPEEAACVTGKNVELTVSN